MRLKSTPDDFHVREATDLRIRKQPAPYRVYLLEKRNWNTVDALQRIAKDLRVPYARFAYGGKKDRHAHTVQYVTVAQTPRDLSFKDKGYSLQFIGFADEPMGPSRILANNFAIVLREMHNTQERQVKAGLARLQERGMPNYFDDQRFGNLDKERGFIGERLLQGRWEEALHLALTAIYPEEERAAKERKRALREQWGDWAACRALARTALEQRSFDLLKERPGAFAEALATVNRETSFMWISTYQSFLWNEIMRRFITRRGWAADSVRGVAGDYLMQTAAAELQGLVIPLPGAKMRFPEPETGLILEEILAERRLRPSSLDREVLPGLAFKASPRPALLTPQSLWVDGPEPDERYPGHIKMRLRMSLPRGSYATMIIKGLMTTDPERPPD